MAKGKLESGVEAGAAIICTACTYCQIQFDTFQAQMLEADDGMQPLPAVLYPQLLGLAMGLGEDQLGLERNAVARRLGGQSPVVNHAPSFGRAQAPRPPGAHGINIMAEKTAGSVMVVGGGIAGMQAALDLADSGFYVYLVEKTASIGGTMSQLDKTFPTNDCAM